MWASTVVIVTLPLWPWTKVWVIWVAYAYSFMRVLCSYPCDTYNTSLMVKGLTVLPDVRHMTVTWSVLQFPRFYFISVTCSYVRSKEQQNHFIPLAANMYKKFIIGNRRGITGFFFKLVLCTMKQFPVYILGKQSLLKARLLYYSLYVKRACFKVRFLNLEKYASICLLQWYAIIVFKTRQYHYTANY